MTTDNDAPAAGLVERLRATFTYEEDEATGPLYYFTPAVRAPGPYRQQRHVNAIVDIAADGSFAGVELIDNMPPLAALQAPQEAGVDVRNAAIAGWNACRRSIYAVCEDVQNEADRLRTTSKPGTPSEEQHAKGYYAGSCFAAKSIARGFNSMEAEDDDNLIAALSALSQPVATPAPREAVGVKHIVRDGCSGSALAFTDGVLHVNKDGSGYIVVDEKNFEIETEYDEGARSDFWITRFPAGEMTALRDFLNGAPIDRAPVVAPAPSQDAAVEALGAIQDWLMQQRTNLCITDPDFMAKHDTFKAVGKHIRELRAATRPVEAQAVAEVEVSPTSVLSIASAALSESNDVLMAVHEWQAGSEMLPLDLWTRVRDVLRKAGRI